MPMQQQRGLMSDDDFHDFVEWLFCAHFFSFSLLGSSACARNSFGSRWKKKIYYFLNIVALKKVPELLGPAVNAI